MSAAVTTLIEAIMKNGMPAATVGVAMPQVVFSQESNPEQSFSISVQLQDADGKFNQIGKVDSDAPKYIEIQYHFCELQRLKFVVSSANASPGSKTSEIGSAITTLGKLVTSHSLELQLSNEAGKITVEAEEITDYRVIEFRVFAEKLDKRDLFGKADPYLQISREDGDNWTVVHKTEFIKDTLSPRWKEFAIRHQILCRGDPDKEIKFACYDHDRSGASDLIGEVLIAPSKFLESKSEDGFLLTHPKKKSKKKERGSGRLFIEKCTVKKHCSFLDYVTSGCQIQFACGIDFTASNGDPRQNGSLHYTGSTSPNKYVQAIQAIGQIVQDYDRDASIPAFGFGAKIPPENIVSHDFPLNFNEGKSCCSGVEELLRCYKNVTNTVKLWGPTNVAPLICHVAEDAAKYAETTSQYTVLLLLIDGVITDVVETKEALTHAAKLPISVIFIGIGNADFVPMEVFNSGVKDLKHHENEETAPRNIVQFVAARKFRFGTASSLARDVLERIPIQVLEYFEMKKLAPAECRTEAATKDHPYEEIEVGPMTPQETNDNATAAEDNGQEIAPNIAQKKEATGDNVPREISVM